MMPAGTRAGPAVILSLNRHRRGDHSHGNGHGSDLPKYRDARGASHQLTLLKMLRLSHAPGQYRVPAKMKIHMAMLDSDYCIWRVAIARRGRSL
jgi:hypothetical protein